MQRILVVIAVVSLLVFRPVEVGAQHQAYPIEPEAPPLCRQNTYVVADINAEDLAFEEKQKDASNIVLTSDVVVELKEDWSYTTRVHKIVKILKEESKYLGEWPVYYDKGREKIKGLEAYTITPDGQRHKYSRIQEFKEYEGYPMYSDSVMKIVTFPEVNVGSILDIKYSRLSKRDIIPGATWSHFDFNASSPVQEMKVKITVPKKLNIQYKEFNLEYKPEVTEDDTTITYYWHIEKLEMSDEEAESFSPPPTVDMITNYVEFSSIEEWSDISDWYYDAIGKNLKITRKIRRTAEEILEGKTTLEDKVRAVLEYVQENFRYVSMSFGENAFEPHPTNKIFRNKYGDCKDLSLLTMAMLEVAGITSYAALFRDEFSITDPRYDLPIPNFFDHVLLLVENPEGDDFYIDPLLDGFDLREYPCYYQNAYTFIITDDGGYFSRFPVFDEMRDYDRKEFIVKIEEDGSTVTEIKGRWDLDSSIQARSYLKDLSEEKRKEVLDRIDETAYSSGNKLERRLDGIDNKYGIITSYFKVKEEEQYPVTDDIMIIDIEGYPKDSSFTRDERTAPIFNPGNYMGERVYTYRIPDNFKISHLPEDLELDIEIMAYKRTYQVEGKEITVTDVVRWRRAELSVEDYPEVKNFFNELPRKTTQRIMLKKIKPWWLPLRQWWREILHEK